MNNEDRAWLILSLAPGLSATDAEALLQHLGGAARLDRVSAADLRRAGIGGETLDAIVHPDEAVLAQTEAWLGAAEGRHLINALSPDYPGLLRELADRPLLLYAVGRRDVLSLPALAIVGSRNPTRGGESNAYEFARHLSKAGLSIVSGLAQGIDAAAHRGALDSGGVTVAYLGHGIDRVYPAANKPLAHAIAENGALVSEFPLGSPPRREHFPQRNRLISGASLGTLVVEAARRSGSLITARLAAEQGREIFAIPGSIHNPLARGTHQLIRQGAKLVERVDDIFSELRAMAGVLVDSSQDEDTAPQATDTADAGRDPDYCLLLDALGHDPVTIDVLAQRSGLTIGQVSSMLLILELEGQIEVLTGGTYLKLE
jgi:DNA processing protein